MFATLLLTASLAAVPPAPSSGLAVVPARIDLGDVPVGRETTEVVWLVNTSHEPLTVVDAKPTCGCTTLLFDPITLAPGAAAPVPFTITAPKTVDKAKTAMVKFRTAWGAPAVFDIALHTVPRVAGIAEAASTEFAGSVRLVPDTANLGPVTGGARTETFAWLINAGDTTARVESIKAGCGCTTIVGFAPTDLAPGTATRVRLAIEPKDRPQPEKTVGLTAVLADGAMVKAKVRMAVVETVASAP